MLRRPDPTVPPAVLAAVLAVLLTGCASAVPATREAPSAQTPAEQGGAPSAPLTSREAALKAELERDVGYLTGQVGERNANKKWEFAGAADWIASQFEANGLGVNRLGVEARNDAVAVDLEGTRRGGKLGQQVVLVSAHYDSHPGSVGADDNATGVAALLALARASRNAHPARTLHLTATAVTGSSAHAQRVGARGDRIYAALNLESLGYYSDRPASQRCPRQLAGTCPPVGNFAALVAGEPAREMLDMATRILTRQATLPVRGFVVDQSGRRDFPSDAWALADIGVRVLTVTDTGAWRNPQHHAAGDTPDRLDFDRLARLVAALEDLVGELSGGNDAEPSQPPPTTSSVTP